MTRFLLLALGWLIISSCTLEVQAFDGQKIESLKQAVVTLETTVSRAAYGKLGQKKSAGYICDKVRGWIITTHDTVGEAGVVASYEVTFSGGQKLEAHLIYADPSKNFAVLSFNTQELLVPIEEIPDFGESTELGEEVLLLGKEGEQDIIQPGLISAKYESVSTFPQEALRVSLNAAGACIGAPILNSSHKVVGLVIQSDKTFVSALWGLFMKDALNDLKAGKIPTRRVLGAVPFSYSLADAVRYMDFPEKKLKEFMGKYPQALAKGLVFLTVTEPNSLLSPGDVLWTIEGKEVGPSLYVLEKALNSSVKNKVRLGVFRRGKLIHLDVPFEVLDPFPIQKMVSWGGAFFYESDKHMERLYGVPRRSVMVSHALPGSPFSDVFFGFLPQDPRFLVVIDQIDGQPIHSLNDVMQEIVRLKGKKYFSIQYRDFGFYLVSGGFLSMSRNSKIAGVNFKASTTSPELLTFSTKEVSWTSTSIREKSQKTFESSVGNKDAA